MIRSIFKREILISCRNVSERINPLFFFLMVIVLFPFAIGPNRESLAQLAPGICWIAALLAMLLTMGGLFHDDWQDGAFEQFKLMSMPLQIIILVKILVHWLVSGLPLILMSPVVGLLFGMTGKNIGILFITLLAGTPVLSLMAAPAAALTVSLKHGGILLSVMVLPLTIPVLILAIGVHDIAGMGFPIYSQLSLLVAIFLSSLMLSPFITAAALRIQTS